MVHNMGTILLIVNRMDHCLDAILFFFSYHKITDNRMTALSCTILSFPICHSVNFEKSTTSILCTVLPFPILSVNCEWFPVFVFVFFFSIVKTHTKKNRNVPFGPVSQSLGQPICYILQMV